MLPEPILRRHKQPFLLPIAGMLRPGYAVFDYLTPTVSKPLIYISRQLACGCKNTAASLSRVPSMPSPNTAHAPGLADAMQLLLGCHDDIRRLSARMLRLDIHLIHYGPDDAAQAAAQDIATYFEREVPMHHADERGDLFPALRRLGDTGIVQSLDALDTEHDALMRMWRGIRPWLHSVRDLRPTQRPNTLGAFAARYPAYADREEREVFGAIRRLPPDQIMPLAGGMLGRRTLHAKR